jgi:hypothetical protein
MAHKKQKVLVRGADGNERELVLLRIDAQTAYVCPLSRYEEAVGNPDLWVGFPIADVRAATGGALVAT